MKAAFQGRPIVFCELPPDLAYTLRDEPYRLGRFTHTWARYETAKTKLPTLVVLEMRPDPMKPGPREKPAGSGCYLARIERSGKVASIQMRLKFTGTHPLGFESFEDLVAALYPSSEPRRMAEGLRTWGHFAPLSFIQDKLIEHLWSKHRAAFERLAGPLPGAVEIPEAKRQQEDAMELAKAFFGLRSTDESPGEIHLQEENAIIHDATRVPGFTLIEQNLQGMFTFRQGEEALTIYNAHAGPIEEMLGVDLVYVNEVQGSIVMVQYKVLERTRETVDRKADWYFRPDPQFHDEIGRMRLPEMKQAPKDYRLHRDPFFFKFVRRKQLPTPSDSSLVLSLAHVQHVLASPAHLGPRGGVRFSYEALQGQYLRESDFIGLVRSGYIGTHRIESDWLKIVLEKISGQKRGLVLGWQRRIQ